MGGDDGIEVVLGPDNPQWCTDRCLRALREVGAPLHLHCQETAAQRAFAVRADGASPVARLARLGVLAPDVTLAHLTHASDEDIALVAAAGARLSGTRPRTCASAAASRACATSPPPASPSGWGWTAAGWPTTATCSRRSASAPLLQRVADTARRR